MAEVGSSLCEQVELDAPVFKHVLVQHMNGLSISVISTLDKLIAGDMQSLSRPHTSETALLMCMYMYMRACGHIS